MGTLMRQDGSGSGQQGLCCKEFGHDAVNWDPENLKERDVTGCLGA